MINSIDYQKSKKKKWIIFKIISSQKNEEYSDKLKEKNKKIFLDEKNELNAKKTDIGNEINERKNKIEQYKSIIEKMILFQSRTK